MIPTYDFITALKFAGHAAATNDVRYYLNGVLFRFSDGLLTLIGTDGHRVAQIKLTVDVGDVRGDWIVKNDSVAALTAAIKVKKSDTSQLLITPAGEKDKDLTVAWGGIVLTLEAQEGKFPDINRALPQKEPVGAPEVHLNLVYFEAAAKALKPLVGGKYKGVKIETRDGRTPVRISGNPDASVPSVQEAPTVHIMPMRP